MNLYKHLVLVALIGSVGLVIGGCRGAKKIQKVIAIPAPHVDTAVASAKTAAPVRDAHADSMQVIHQAVAGLTRNHIDFQTFSGHLHVHYQGSDGKDYEVNAVVHIKKDSMIWVSINAALGIEALRMLITPDSVKILEKLKKIARLRSVSYLQEQVHLPVNFYTLQELLIGNPIFVDTSGILYYRSEARGLTLFCVGPYFTNLLTLNPDFTQQHSKLDDTDPLRARTGDMTYGDYNYSGAVPFSTYRKISVAERSKVDIEIGYKQFKFNEVLSYPFSIPKNYKRR
ncbi:MAG TPA: DUF4292 domain-containing protein [Puia sp.]|jgi:hypothetical protein|nr:DUF4292 domain-containing protein [Puia sp.]